MSSDVVVENDGWIDCLMKTLNSAQMDQSTREKNN